MNSHPERFKAFKKIGTGSVCLRPVSVMSDGYSTVSVARFPGIPNQACEFLNKWLKQPVVGFLVLKSVPAKQIGRSKVNALMINVDSKAANGVETTSVQMVPYNEALFVVPQGYRTVKRLEDTYYSSKRKRDLESIVDDLGVGVDLFKK